MLALMLCDFANSWFGTSIFTNIPSKIKNQMQNNSAIIARGLYTLVTEGPIFFWEVLGFDI